MEIPKINFELAKVIRSGKYRLFVTDVIYSIVEKDWLVIYHILNKLDIITETRTVSLDVFNFMLVDGSDLDEE